MGVLSSVNVIHPRARRDRATKRSRRVVYRAEMSESRPATPFGALGVLASQQVEVAPGLRHIELFTRGGLLTLLWHDPPADVAADGRALVLCGGAMGGLLGPAEGLYHQLGTTWAARGVAVVRVSSRRPGDLDAGALDAAATIELLSKAGADRVIVMGHSFGGAVAVQMGIGLDPLVVGVVTFATQSAGCEDAGEWGDKPLLLFHVADDEILPLFSSEMVRMITGAGELVVLPDDGHLLTRSREAIWSRLETWIPATFDHHDTP